MYVRVDMGVTASHFWLKITYCCLKIVSTQSLKNSYRALFFQILAKRLGGIIVTENRWKERSMQTPIEKHDTAPWANIEKTKPVSNVAIPNEEDVDYAKQWVDMNQK